MRRRFLLMGLAGVVGALIATLPIVTATATQPLPMTGSFVTSDFAFTAAGGGTTVSIATGGTVDFSYPTGSSEHNVDFGTGPQPTSCMLSGSNHAPPIPTAATAPGWSGSCTFNTPGTYTFHCDKHTFMTGTIVVGSEASTTTSTSTGDTTTGSGTTNPDYPSPTMTMPMNMPMPTESTTTKATTPVSSPLVGSPQSAIKIATAQTGGQVRGTLKISSPGRGGHVVITVLAARGALKHGATHAKQLITLGSKRLGGLRPGTAKFTVAVNHTGKLALSAYRRLPATVRITVTAPKGKTVTFSKTVVLHG
jgi:plastocyanin